MKLSLAWCALLLLIPWPALASGIDLTWSACPGDGGVNDINLPCAEFEGFRTLYGTVRSPVDVGNFVAMEVTLDLRADSVTLPAFFDMLEPLFNPTGCNEGWYFGDERPASCTSASPELWGTLPPGGQANLYAEFRSVGGARGYFRATVFRTTPIAVLANVEYFAFKLDLYTGSAVEAGGTCTGCAIPTVWVWREARLQRTAGAPVVVTQPGAVGLAVTTFGGGSLPDWVPARPSSWGTLKALFR